jgi:hypothetical protein
VFFFSLLLCGLSFSMGQLMLDGAVYSCICGSVIDVMSSCLSSIRHCDAAVVER